MTCAKLVVVKSVIIEHLFENDPIFMLETFIYFSIYDKTSKKTFATTLCRAFQNHWLVNEII